MSLGRSGSGVLFHGLSSASGVLLHGLKPLACVLSSKVLYLVSLLANYISSVFELAVDELLVLKVDQRSEEDDTGCDQGHAPEGNNLDEVIGQECSQESLFEISVSSFARMTFDSQRQ